MFKKILDPLLHSYFSRYFSNLLVYGFLPEEIPCLFTPFSHTTLLSFWRTSIIIGRARFIALVFAILTPLWSLVDYFFFPFHLWLSLFILRICASLAFFAFFRYYRSDGRLLDAYRAMLVLSLIPTIFYLACNTILSSFQLLGSAATFAIGYSFLPFVFLCCLAIFPLTILENLVFAAPILFAQALSSLLDKPYPVISSLFTSNLVTLWLLGILTGISLFACISQMGMMMALIRRSAYDILTSVFTRNSCEKLLDIQFGVSSRTQTPLSVVFIDLDYFKEINDCFGHERGDQVLQEAASMIAQTLRVEDILARWGGEEFLVIMPNTHIKEAAIAIDRLSQHGLGKRPDGTPLTASIGIAERLRDNAMNNRQLVEIADFRMYCAKKNGRNAIVTEGFSPPSEHEGPPSLKAANNA